VTTYYVRKTGSDGASGTSAATAWLTIDKAANTVAAGDTVYIGAGVYRELVTMDTGGGSGSQISYVADITGENTGDAGMVIISGYDADTDANPTRAACWDMDGKTFITLSGIGMLGSTCITDNQDAGARAYEGVILEDCVLIGYVQAILLDFNAGVTPSTTGLIIRRCSTSIINFWHDGNGSAHINLKSVIENNIIHAYLSTDTTYGIVTYSFGGAFTVGGMTFSNNTVWGAQYGIAMGAFNNTTDVTIIANTLGACRTNIVTNIGGTAGAVAAYNTFSLSTQTPVSGTTVNSNPKYGTSLLGGIGDTHLLSTFGWSPFRPFEAMAIAGYVSSIIGNGSATYAPADDLYGNPRPMGRSTDDVGAVEARTRLRQKTSSPIEGTISGEFVGAGYHDFIGVPVTNVSTTVTCKAKYDGNYTGTLPQLIVYSGGGAILGSDTMVVAANTEETLSVNFTPSAIGVVRIRIQSNDTSATGTCHFDTLSVSA
jgi:hypothetical protein